MAKNPRNYPDTIPSAESGRPMTRGEKLVTFKIEGAPSPTSNLAGGAH